MVMQTILRKKTIKVSIVTLPILIVIYLGISMYFSNHFYYGFVINGIDASCKTVEEVDTEMLTKSKTYTLDLKERNGVKEQIKANEIGLKYNVKDKIQALKESQNSFTWIFSFFSPKTSEMNGIVTYDDKLLKERFDKLAVSDSKKIIEPKNVSFKYSDKGYVIEKEVKGNKVDSKQLYANLVSAIVKGETTIDLEAKNYYINPKYTSTSQKVKNTKILLNKYITSKITYTFAGGEEVLDGATIHNFLGVDENLEITFDKDKMDDYVKKVDNNYNTYGKQRNFATSLGTTVKVSGGDYGWLVNRSGEVNDLIVAIKGGQTIKKEPHYTQTAASHDINDIGSTYVEINLTKQHLWFYKNGSLVVQGDVVTGDVSKNHATPAGVYVLKYKEKNATLKGEGYSTPVDVFMPFNGGIGIHDASWRNNKFGKNIYLTNGSHGCINSPPILAKTIYNNIKAGTPVVCY
ncbi:L,D-transpeptidase/peptidoglycan binding protein [Clostridium estertheticum]|uniref:L,D-transpeptidase family protein n=1 Tax=Clostridium estertheticum TaxID=238834 RepID=UPI001C0C2226|nr:L,D-transpeptidase/peptidoglycan binding protein [Clostridium estertheticum]WAG67712.1 L,D-transpeptidase/peptidoglycan binding protein [Clostridium estertheticum]